MDRYRWSDAFGKAEFTGNYVDGMHMYSIMKGVCDQVEASGARGGRS